MASSSKTATSSRTEVRSPTRTSTWANTRGNFTATVTGGAGAGNTSVNILPGKTNPSSRKRKLVTVGYVASGLNAGQFAVKVNGKTVQLRHDKGMAQRVATLYRKNKMRERAARSLRKARKSK